MRLIGIDYSMSGPAMAIWNPADGPMSPSTCSFYYMTDRKKSCGTFGERIVGAPLPSDYASQEERFDEISRWFVNLVSPGDVVAIEDYAFGATGRVFHIAENCGLLKHKLYAADIGITTYAPSAIKKLATGKGNADKALMREAFMAESGVDPRSMFPTPPGSWSPSGDCVDAFFICRKLAIDKKLSPAQLTPKEQPG